MGRLRISAVGYGLAACAMLIGLGCRSKNSSDGGPGISDSGRDGTARDGGGSDGSAGDGESLDGGDQDTGLPDRAIGGDCRTRADCTPGFQCTAGRCVQCTAPVGGMLYAHADPAIGDDSALASSSDCPFHSLKRALEVLGSTIAGDVRITLSGGSNFPYQAPAETFPVVVPEHVRIVGSTASPPTIVPGMGETAFILSAPNSGLSRLAIDGRSAAEAGVEATTGSEATTAIDHLTISNMTGDGILLLNESGSNEGGTLSIGPGVSCSSNQNGLEITDNAAVMITGATTGAPADLISFNRNSLFGILVTGRGSLTLTGTASSDALQNVVAKDNAFAGVAIWQTPGPDLPVNDIRGVTASGNGMQGMEGGAGLLLQAGSMVRVRRSLFTGNHGSGVVVTRDSSGAVSDVSQLDLGADPMDDPGRNVVQLGSGNDGAGICLTVDDPMAMLLAAGNVFAGPNDCAGAMPRMLMLGDSCSAHADIAIEGAGEIDTAGCTVP